MKPHLVDAAHPFDAGGYHTHKKTLLGHFNLSHTRLTKRKWPISLSLSEVCVNKRPQRLANIEETAGNTSVISYILQSTALTQSISLQNKVLPRQHRVHGYGLAQTWGSHDN